MGTTFWSEVSESDGSAIELHKSSPVWVQKQMVQAVDAGAKIVNMSMQFIYNNQCGTPGTDETRLKVLETNAIRQGKDVLWVFAAGKERCEAIYASPASLTLHYPDNTIAVASIDQSRGVSMFFNGGSGVGISAPGSAPSSRGRVTSGSSVRRRLFSAGVTALAPYAEVRIRRTPATPRPSARVRTSQEALNLLEIRAPT